MTDDEIRSIWHQTPVSASIVDFARALLAAAAQSQASEPGALTDEAITAAIAPAFIGEARDFTRSGIVVELGELLRVVRKFAAQKAGPPC